MLCHLALCWGMFRASAKWWHVNNQSEWQSRTALPCDWTSAFWGPILLGFLSLLPTFICLQEDVSKACSALRDSVRWIWWHLECWLLYQHSQGWVLQWKQTEHLFSLSGHGSHKPSPGWGFWTCSSPREMQNNLAAYYWPSVKGISAYSHLDKAIWSLAEIFICTNVWLPSLLKNPLGLMGTLLPTWSLVFAVYPMSWESACFLWSHSPCCQRDESEIIEPGPQQYFLCSAWKRCWKNVAVFCRKLWRFINNNNNVFENVSSEFMRKFEDGWKFLLRENNINPAFNLHWHNSFDNSTLIID